MMYPSNDVSTLDASLMEFVDVSKLARYFVVVCISGFGLGSLCIGSSSDSLRDLHTIVLDALMFEL